MKLKIKNLTKIIGQNVPYEDWMVDNVNESDDMYTFLCCSDNSTSGNPTGWSVSVRLKRDPIVEWNGFKYRFFRYPGESSYNQVTADWFGDIENAKQVIASEIKRIVTK